MENCRVYGAPPYHTVLLHGGPGAAGEMAPVARELASRRGVLEPFQTRPSVDGQIEELKSTLEESAGKPVFLVGYSWGAWLGFLFTARYPEWVEKLLLVSSGPYEEKYAPRIRENRLGRLSRLEKKELESLEKHLEDPVSFARYGELLSLSDHYDPLPMNAEPMVLRPDLFRDVWREASELRKSGELLMQAKLIHCPVVAIHGDRDPHPAQGVEKPLGKSLQNFRFILLEKCGHTPWMEKQAREKFFEVLLKELG